MSYTSLKTCRAQDPELQKIIADGRKQLYKSLDIISKKIDIIIDQSHNLEQLGLDMMRIQSGLNSNNAEQYIRRHHEKILNTLIAWKNIPGFDTLFDSYIKQVTKTGRKPDIFRLESFSNNGIEFDVYIISKIEKNVTHQKRIKDPEFSWRGHRNNNKRTRVK